MSYCPKGYHGWNNQKPSNFLLDTYKLSANLILKHYGEVCLITDSNSKKYFESIPFTKVDTILDEFLIPEEYQKVWSLSKIFAYKYLSLNGESFIHIDNDVFLWKPLPINFTKLGLLAQSPETKINYFYKLNDFYKRCPKKYIAQYARTNYAPNAGVFGGSNLGFIYKYSSSALDMVLDPVNKKFWTEDNFGATWRKAVYAEQYYLAVCAEYYEQKINFLFNEGEFSPIKCAEIGYTHLLAAKKGKYIPEKIKLIIKLMNF
jgi:hypothetical protein